MKCCEIVLIFLIGILVLMLTIENIKGGKKYVTKTIFYFVAVFLAGYELIVSANEFMPSQVVVLLISLIEVVDNFTMACRVDNSKE